MALKLFISYRREDSAGHAGRMYDRLEREFGRDLLVMDVDSIPLGVNFVKALGEEVAKCDVLLAIIGPGWLDARDENSRCQIGSGGIDPAHDAGWSGRRQDLDGTKSCSVIVDPELVTAAFSSPEFPETRWLTEEDFWRDEFDPQRPVPTRLEDLVIYELHVDGLGLGRSPRGTLQDAIDSNRL